MEKVRTIVLSVIMLIFVVGLSAQENRPSPNSRIPHFGSATGIQGQPDTTALRRQLAAKDKQIVELRREVVLLRRILEKHNIEYQEYRKQQAIEDRQAAREGRESEIVVESSVPDEITFHSKYEVGKTASLPASYTIRTVSVQDDFIVVKLIGPIPDMKVSNPAQVSMGGAVSSSSSGVDPAEKIARQKRREASIENAPLVAIKGIPTENLVTGHKLDLSGQFDITGTMQYQDKRIFVLEAIIPGTGIK